MKDLIMHYAILRRTYVRGREARFRFDTQLRLCGVVENTHTQISRVNSRAGEFIHEEVCGIAAENLFKVFFIGSMTVGVYSKLLDDRWIPSIHIFISIYVHIPDINATVRKIRHSKDRDSG